MMSNKKMFVSIIFLFYFAGKIEHSAGTEFGIPRLADVINYGPYYIVSRSIDVCTLTGPKDAENEIKQTLRVSKVDRIREVFRGNVTIRHDLSNVSISISNEVWRDGGYKPFFYKMYRKPCEEKAVLYFMKNFFNGDTNCSVKKGNYTVDNVSPTVIMKDVIGTSFFYERISLTISAHTRKGYIACIRFLCESKPLPKKRQMTRYNSKTTN